MALRIGDLVGFIRADDSGMRRGLNDAELRMRGFQRDTEGRLRTLDGRFATLGERAALGFRTASDDGDRLNRTLGRIVGMASGLGKVALSAGKMVATLGAAVPVAAGLVATLAQIAPAAGVAATGIVSIGLAMAAFKIGMQGVGDALKNAFDPDSAEAFNEALKKLSPNAREFVLAIQDLQPAFEKVKIKVQDALFRGLGETVTATAAAVRDDLTRGLTLSAGALNLMALQTLNVAAGLGKSGALGQAVDSASRGLFNMAALPSVIVQGLVQVGAAAGPAFERLTKAGGRSLDRISQKMTAAFESGAMEDAIETAIDLLGDLREIAGNVMGIVKNLFGAASVSGGGFIEILKTITQSLEDAFASSGVQDGLRAIFKTMAEIAKVAGPLLITVLQAVAPIFTALGPPIQRLIQALGKALTPIIKALAPILDALADVVGILIDAFSPFLDIIADLIVIALKPLKPIIEKLSEVLAAMAPIIQKVAELAGKVFGAALEGLGEIALQLAIALGDGLLKIMPSLMDVVIALEPVFIALADAVGDILTELAPLLPMLVDLALVVIMQVLPAILPLLPPLAKLVAAFIRFGAWAITTIVIPALKGLIAFITGVQKGFQPLWDAVEWVTGGVADMFQWLYDLLVGHSIIPDLINDISAWFGRLPGMVLGALQRFVEFVQRSVNDAVRWFQSLPGKASRALSGLPGALGRMAASAGQQLVSTVSRNINSAVRYIQGLPGRAAGALSGIGRTLYNAGWGLMQGFISGIVSQFNRIRSTLGNLTSMLPSWKGPEALDARILTPAGRSLIAGFQRGIAQQTPSLRHQLGSLTAELPAMAGAAAAGAAGGGMGGVSIKEFHAGGRSERQIAEELWWLGKGRG